MFLNIWILSDFNIISADIQWPCKRFRTFFCNIKMFTCVFWQNVWIANILVSYPEFGRNGE